MSDMYLGFKREVFERKKKGDKRKKKWEMLIGVLCIPYWEAGLSLKEDSQTGKIKPWSYEESRHWIQMYFMDFT